jgi:hypothetical protein
LVSSSSSALRHRRHAVFCALAAFVVLAAAGLASPRSSAWAIDVKPVMLRVDRGAGGPHARAFGLDVNVRLLSLHAHLGWRGVPLPVPAPVER